MKDYYQILRIGRKASGTEIKRAYRSLAVVFHPDRNQSAEASALFQEINEAHEVLSDPDKRFRYDQTLDGSFSVDVEPSQQQWHRDPAYRRSHAPGYKRPTPQPPERLLMMLHFLKYLRIISLIGIGWCALLFLDYLLPFRIYEERVLPESNRAISWKFHHIPNVVVTDKGHQFPVPFDGVEFFPVGSTIGVFTTKITHVLVKVEAESKKYTITKLATIYQTFLLGPVILFILSILGLMLKKGIEFRFNIEVSICIVLGFNLIFLIFSIL